MLENPDSTPNSSVRDRRNGADAKIPLYRQIANGLIRDIQKGTYKVGEVLPTEVALAARLGVSRGSVREALQILADGQIVERARKLGTRVLRAQPRTGGYIQRLDSFSDTLGFAGETVLHIKDVCDVRQTHEPLLQEEVSPTGFWLQITGVRHLPGDSEARTTWSRTHVSGQFSGIRPLLTGKVPSIYTLIEKAYGLRIARLRHKVTAIALPDYAAAALDLAVGGPALEVDAWVLADNGALIEFVRSIHNPARFSMEFSVQSTG